MKFDVDLVQVGIRIYNRRRELGLTQEALADKLDVSVQMISNLERGNKAIKIDNLVGLSQVLGVSTDFILTGKKTFDCTDEKMEALSSVDKEMINVLVDFCISKKNSDS